MIKLKRSTRRILAELLKAHGKLDAFTLFKRSMMSFTEFARSTETLFSEKLAGEDDAGVVFLTKTGRDYINRIEPIAGIRKWREVPEHLTVGPHSLDDPYIPNIRILDKGTFFMNEESVD